MAVIRKLDGGWRVHSPRHPKLKPRVFPTLYLAFGYAAELEPGRRPQVHGLPPEERAARNRELTRQWHRDNGEYIIIARRAWRRCNPDKRHEQRQRWRERYPERDHAHRVVERAVKAGKLPPVKTLKCNRCRAPASLYHHEDYGRPLDVEPLCHRCHNGIHKPDARI